MIPIEKIEAIVARHEAIEKELSSGNIDSKTYPKKSKEYSDLGNIVDSAKEYLKFREEKNGLEQILEDKTGDKDMSILAEKEIKIIKEKREINENKLKVFYYQKIKMIKKML